MSPKAGSCFDGPNSSVSLSLGSLGTEAKCGFVYTCEIPDMGMAASYGSPKWLDPMGEESQQEVAFQNIATWLMEDVNKHGGCTQTEKDQCTCI